MGLDRCDRDEELGGDLLVLAPLAGKPRDALLGVGQRHVAGAAAADAPELVAGLRGPERRLQRLEGRQRLLEGFARRAAHAGVALRGAEAQQRASPLEGVRRASGAGERSRIGRDRLGGVAVRGGEEAGAAIGAEPRPAVGASRQSGVLGQAAAGGLELAEPDERLDGVGPWTVDGIAVPGAQEARGEVAKVAVGGLDVAEGELELAERR